MLQHTPCTDQEINQCIREIEVAKHLPDCRNTRWNQFATTYRLFYCRCTRLGDELKKLEDQQAVISLEVKRCGASVKKALEALVKSFKKLEKRL